MSEQEYISLLELQRLIKGELESRFALGIWVVAEISELKVNYSGHCYLELIEKGGKNGIPSAKSNAVIWKSKFGAINAFFRSETGSDLAVGMRVLLKVSVSFHELYGMSLQITDVNPSFTLGEQAKQRELTIAQLKEDGVYDMNRELELEYPIQRVAVISSESAAGFQDFYKELSVSKYDIQISLYDAFMQGAGAEYSIIGALERIADSQIEYDAVVVIRGGGSQSDLSCFNSYELCSHLAQFPLPIIAGIGHDKDQSVADLVACVSLKTPTAVARFLIDSAMQFEEGLNALSEDLNSCVYDILKSYNAQLDQIVFGLSRISAKFTQNLRLRLQSLQSGLENSFLSLIKVQKKELQGNSEVLASRPLERLKLARVNLERCESLVDASRPEKILAKGFSVVRVDGRAVSDSSTLSSGQRVSIQLSRGEISAMVE